MKSVDEGIARHCSQIDLVGTVSDFFLPQSYTNVPLLLENAKNIPAHYLLLTLRKIYDVKLTSQDHQNENFIWIQNVMSVETTSNMHGAGILQEKNVCQPLQPRIVQFFHY